MAGQIVPVHQAHRNYLSLAPFVAPWIGQQLSSFANSRPAFLKEQLKKLGQRAKRAIKGTRKFNSHTMPSGRKYSRKKRSRKSMYKKRPRAVRREQALRKRARKRGNVRAAKKLVLPLGGYQERRIIRLKDVISFKGAYTGASLNGTEHLYNGVPYSTKLAQHVSNPALHSDPKLGKCQQYVFFMNDLRNFYGQGRFVARQPGSPIAKNSWVEPNLDHDGANVLRKIPLSRVHSKTFRSYTVIGTEMIVKITNNEMGKYSQSDPSAPYAVAPSHKVWYAWRLIAANTGTPIDEATEIPFPVEPDTTYQALRETGKWRMGIVSSSSTDKYATRTFKIAFNSKRLFGAEEGKPGATNLPCP